MKRTLIAFFLLIGISAGYSQEYYSNEAPRPFWDIGFGLGLDYGGIIGIKATGLPSNRVGIFGSLGYYLFAPAFNTGVNLYLVKNNSDKIFRPLLKVMYGVNCGIMVVGKEEYNDTYRGFTPGAGFAFRFGSRKKHGFDVDLNFPIRPSEYYDDEDIVRNDPQVDFTSTTMPFQISLGYHITF